MSGGSISLSDLSAVKLALMADDVRARAAPVLRADPIAIVGMACRTPGGVESPKALWDLLAAGKTTAREIPADRFDIAAWHDPDPAMPGKSLTRHGSFLDRVDLFDADYFGIVAREAEEMDPQQRSMAVVGYILNLTVWIGPLIIYLLKKDDPTTKPWLRQQLANALNWGLTMQIGIILGIATTPLFCIGAIFNIALLITNIVFVILNAMKANKGESAGVPFAFKFVK